MWAEVQLAERCGPRLADALTGAVPYQELLFPGGSMEAVLPVYESGANATFYNECVVAAIEVVLAQLPADRSMNVLEIGAGTGGTASSVLPALKGRCTRYVFTDVSEVRGFPLTPVRQYFADTLLCCTCAGLSAPGTAAIRRLQLRRVLAAQH